jgi:hypothetical protein
VRRAPLALGAFLASVRWLYASFRDARSARLTTRDDAVGCVANTFSAANAASCTACPAFSFSTAGSSTCRCLAGYFATGSGASLVCSRTLGAVLKGGGRFPC